MKANFSILILLLYTCVLSGQEVSFSGTVILEDNVPAIGATVQIENTSRATITDENGVFSITGITPNTYTVRIEYLGMEPFIRELDLTASLSDYVATLTSSSEIIDEVIVTAKSESKQQTEQAIQIQSIELKEVATQVKDLTDVIDQLSGVRVRTSGSLGDRVDINLNGLNGTAVRTYLDGMPLEFIFPSASLSNIPLSNVKRIDVYKGVVPVTVGTDAMGGGVNVISEYKPFSSLKASYSFGSFNTHQATLTGNYAINDHVIVSANGAYNRSDNNYEMNAYVWEDRDTARVKRFHDAYELSFVQTALVLKKLSWTDETRVSVNYTDYYKEYQHGGKIGRTAYGGANYNGSNKNLVLDYRKALNKYISLENIVSIGRENVIFTDTTANRYSWSGEVISRSRKGEFGGSSIADQKRNTLVNRTNLTFAIDDNTKVFVSNLYANMDLSGRDTELPKEKDQLTKPQILTKDIVGVELRRYLFDKDLQLSAAIKNYIYILDASDPRSLTPIKKDNSILGWYATSKYDITDRFFVRASYEKALRIPTFVQFFGNGTNIVSNVNLNPETSDNYNIGLTYQSSKENRNFNFLVSANTFQRAQKDIIFLSGQLRQRYVNAESVSSKGVELETTFNFFENFSLSLNVTKLEKTYESIDSSLITSQFLVGTAFPNTPKIFGNARLAYRSKNIFGTGNGFTCYAQYKYVDEFNFINVSKTRNDKNWVPSQHRVDAGITYTFMDDKLSVSTNVFNILDKELFDNFKIPRPGRNFNVKIVYQINNIK